MPQRRLEHQARSDNVTNTRKRTANKPVYGNFQRYYHIRNPTAVATDDEEQGSTDVPAVHPALALDSRVSAILTYLAASQSGDSASAESSQSKISVLDIGCNSGKLTIQLAQTLPLLLRSTSEVEIAGVDIDPKLIEQAKEADAVARSLRRPKHIPASTTQQKQVEPQLPAEAAFFPSVFPSLFGTVDGPAGSTRSSKRQRIEATDTASTAEVETSGDESDQLAPPHLRFLAAEWVRLSPSLPTDPFHYTSHDLSQLTHLDSCGYTHILALSLTKWIHIQQSDSGLCLFFARIASTLLPGGLLFLEAQQWKSYHSARSMHPSMKHKIKSLQLRPGGDFDWLLESLGLHLVDTIGWGTGLGFKRPLQVFRKEEGVKEAERLVEEVLEGKGEVRFDWVARSSTAAN